LAAELSSVRLIEQGVPGLVRLDHRSGAHDDMAIATAMVAATLLDGPTGPAKLHVPEGDLPPVQLVPKRALPDREPPPRVVKDGEARPTDRLLSFAAARRHPGYQPPGGPRR
jgi:hypothetical protein